MSGLRSVDGSTELAICTARIEGCRVEPRALLHALCHYTLRAKIILADFNLAVSTQTAKLPNLIPRQIFRLYGMEREDILGDKLREVLRDGFIENS